jgi:predicted MFS family arabinose efflux permease
MTGLSQNYFQFIMYRCVYAVGYSAMYPMVLSLIADLFAENRRATCIAILNIAGFFAYGISFNVGYFINDNENMWRNVFFVLGIPGFILSLLTVISFREPMKGNVDKDSVQITPDTNETLIYISKTPSFWLLSIGTGIGLMAGSASGTWIPTLYYREFEMKIEELGQWFMFIIPISGFVGTIAAGWLCDFCTKFDNRSPVLICLISTILSIPAVTMVYLIPIKEIS